MRKIQQYPGRWGVRYVNSKKIAGFKATELENHCHDVNLIMRVHPVGLFLLFIILSVAACKKNNQAIDHSDIVGKWTWINSSLGNSILITQASGVRKNLTFTNNGTIYINHNDSTGSPTYLNVFNPVVLLTKSVADTETYQIISVTSPCVAIKYSALTIKARVYQYSIVNDTLQISNSPCLAPFNTTYTRD